MLSKKLFFTTLCASFLATLLYSPPTRAAPQLIFLCIPGQPGSATLRGFEDCIEIHSYAQEFSKRKEACKISFIKEFDPASISFALQAVSGTMISQGTFHFFSDSDVPAVLLEVEFSNWKVKKVRASGEEGDVEAALAEVVELRRTASSSLSITRFPPGGAPETENMDCS
ncbi:MAG: type VI secretion system tube protein Hcp [Deltaproteobacteria bacterium]|nr:type VI secretion system tube protein Hcp [Deltaproteobacteria bacterium]